MVETVIASQAVESLAVHNICSSYQSQSDTAADAAQQLQGEDGGAANGGEDSPAGEEGCSGHGGPESSGGAVTEARDRQPGQRPAPSHEHLRCHRLEEQSSNG